MRADRFCWYSIVNFPCIYLGVSLYFGTNVSIVKDKVLEKAKELEQVHAKNFNRGDKKVSLIDFSTWVTSYGFNMRETYKFGPVDQLGGMGVIVFVKK